MKTRLVLKPLKNGDIENIMNWVNDPEPASERSSK
ncbi:MAG: hypothetical protein UW30_C0003G0031 [Candidatus Giovannonibacteria bacterium GW2011_GWA2_44_13b]|uniref:Uncharacterized protein n=1 Tax=Candidatus Giovannonibacteria bacterium GW2011_GWA2_44_13b TaxID=1618647 RepID=A0A0G1H3D1_9BACT|nr:MAG: hypothetical protein UW30_C0003G0031 [Candidatus Giovannonibacteria bacterium GW2011_GWA2_44_13b]